MHCVIVDDEYPAREELKYFIQQDKNFTLLAEFENSLDALEFIQMRATEIDVVFFDIHMPELNGLSLAKIIQKLAKHIKIIFVTAHRDYAVEAFEVKAFDYLLKPFSEERIESLLESLSQTQSSFRDKISIPMGEKILILDIDDISVIEADKKECRLYTKTGCHLSKMKISDWENLLPKNLFYRCHRSYLIHLSKVQEVETFFNHSLLVHMEHRSLPVPVSRNNNKEFKKLFHMMNCNKYCDSLMSF